MNAPKVTAEKLSKLVQAWQDLTPDKLFGGMNLADFKTKVQPSLDARAAVNAAEVQLVDSIARRQASDSESQKLIQLVVNSIKGDPALGDDSALYEAAGYVRRSERKSGLSRKPKSTQPSPAKAA
jgi:hypothetical protein